ncbi:MAG: peroxiredoxin [Halobacteriales archaeon]
MLEPGEVAPPFELRNQDGDVVSLADFRGQRVVVYFYPRAGTAGCTREANEYADRLGEFRDRDVAVVGVSDDDVEDLAAFAADEDLPFDLLSDPDGEVARAYDSYGTRSIGDREVTASFRNTYVVDGDGIVEAAYEGVDPVGHVDDVLAGL